MAPMHCMHCMDLRPDMHLGRRRHGVGWLLVARHPGVTRSERSPEGRVLVVGLWLSVPCFGCWMAGPYSCSYILHTCKGLCCCDSPWCLAVVAESSGQSCGPECVTL